MSISPFCRSLLLAIDPHCSIDELQCSLCRNLFDTADRIPVIACSSAACNEHHCICISCYAEIAEQKKKQDQEATIPNGETTDAKCPFCQETLVQPKADQRRIDLCKPLEETVQKLTEIQTTLQNITEQKLQQVVGSLNSEIKMHKDEASRMGQKIKSLKKGMKILEEKIRTDTISLEEKLSNIKEKEEALKKKELQSTSYVQRLLDEIKTLKTKSGEQGLLIDQLERENFKLKEKLEKHENLESLQTRIRHVPTKSRIGKETNIFNFGTTFRQFKFRPCRDQSFIMNFQEGSHHEIQLRKEREQHFIAKGGKVVRHQEFFSFDKPQDKLICFKIKGLNPNTRSYKFGLMDKNGEAIPGVNLFIDISKTDLQSEPVTVFYYVDLVKMKLFASMKELREEATIPKKINLNKFTVYLYFVDIDTQIRVE